MNAIALLLAVLVVAYIGGRLSVARGVRGYSLPSGVEYVVLGAALGPSALAVVDRSTLSSLAPVFVFALGWIALEQGVECGFVEEHRVSPTRVLIGGVVGGVLALTIALAVFLVLGRFAVVPEEQRLLTSVGIALVSCESTRHGLRWVAEHHGAEGPLSRLISDISSVDAAVPLVVLAWWFAAQGTQPSEVLQTLPPSTLTALALGLGVVLGALVIVLLQTTVRSVDGWGVLLGGSLIGVGVAHGSGISWMTTMFAMGVTLSLTTDQRARVRGKLEKTEHPVLLPILALAGAHIDVQGIPDVLPILPVALLARAVVTAVVGLMAGVVSSTAARGGPWLGLSLMSSGAVTLCIGFACALHAPGVMGQVILVAAVFDTLIGELIGPIGLRRTLRRAGEIAEDDESTQSASLAGQERSS